MFKTDYGTHVIGELLNEKRLEFLRENMRFDYVRCAVIVLVATYGLVGERRCVLWLH